MKTQTYDSKAAELFADISDVPQYFVDAHKSMGVDAQETLVFARQLETISRRVYETKYTALKGKTFIPEGNEANETTEYLTYRIWDGYTMAKVIAAGEQTDIPLVGASAREVSVKGYRAASAYQYDIDELRAANAAGVPLIDMKAKQVRMSFELLREEHSAFGLPEGNTFGLLNHPNVSTVSLPNGDWSNPATTGLEMLEDLDHMVTTMLTGTEGILEGNTLLLTLAALRKISTTFINTANSSNITVLEAFRSHNPGIAVDWWNKLDNAGPGDTPMMVFYRKDPEVLAFEVATPFEQMPVEVRGWTYTVAARVKWFGLQVFLPMGISYAFPGL